MKLRYDFDSSQKTYRTFPQRMVQSTGLADRWSFLRWCCPFCLEKPRARSRASSGVPVIRITRPRSPDSDPDSDEELQWQGSRGRNFDSTVRSSQSGGWVEPYVDDASVGSSVGSGELENINEEHKHSRDDDYDTDSVWSKSSIKSKDSMKSKSSVTDSLKSKTSLKNKRSKDSKKNAKDSSRSSRDSFVDKDSTKTRSPMKKIFKQLKRTTSSGSTSSAESRGDDHTLMKSASQREDSRKGGAKRPAAASDGRWRSMTLNNQDSRNRDTELQRSSFSEFRSQTLKNGARGVHEGQGRGGEVCFSDGRGHRISSGGWEEKEEPESSHTRPRKHQVQEGNKPEVRDEKINSGSKTSGRYVDRNSISSTTPLEPAKGERSLKTSAKFEPPEKSLKDKGREEDHGAGQLPAQVQSCPPEAPERKSKVYDPPGKQQQQQQHHHHQQPCQEFPTPTTTLSPQHSSSPAPEAVPSTRPHDNASTHTRPHGGGSTPTLGYSTDSTHTNTNSRPYTPVLGYSLSSTPTVSARSTPTTTRRRLPSPLKFWSETSPPPPRTEQSKDTPDDSYTHTLVRPRPDYNDKLITPTTTTAPVASTSSTLTPAAISQNFYASIETSPRPHSKWARKFPTTRKDKTEEQTSTYSQDEHSQLLEKKSQLKRSHSFTPARPHSEVNAPKSSTREAVKRASSFLPARPYTKIFPPTVTPLVIVTPPPTTLPQIRTPTPPPRSRKLTASCSTFPAIPECAGEADETSVGGEDSGGGGGGGGAGGEMSTTPGGGGVGGGGQKSGSPSPLVGSVGRISGRDSVASLTSSTDTSCLTHPDEDIERLLQLNEKKISSLTPLGSRSESMASVCSAGAEGRYGTVIIRGEIELGLQYNYKEGQLEVHVAQCRDLAAVDNKRNRSDPYVKVYLLPDKSKSGKRKTKVKKHTLNPVFEEVLKFSTTMSELESRTLWVSVWHSDMFGRNDFLGEVIITLADTVFDDVSPKWYPLQDRMEPMEELSYSPRGDLILALKFVPPDAVSSKKTRRSRGALHVLVKEAKSLAAVRPHGTADPICKGLLLPEKGKASKQKTSVCRKTLNPTWNHTLVFDDTSLQELTERALELSVWDHDRLGPSHFLGSCRLSLGKGKHGGRPVEWMEAAGMEVKLWEQMLDRPNLWVEGSIMLRPTMDKPIYSSSMTE